MCGRVRSLNVVTGSDFVLDSETVIGLPVTDAVRNIAAISDLER